MPGSIRRRQRSDSDRPASMARLILQLAPPRTSAHTADRAVIRSLVAVRGVDP
jgi:hypothetical protein